MTIAFQDILSGKIDLNRQTSRRKPALVAPGTILREIFMEPLGLTAYQLAKGTHLSPTAVSEILRGKRALTIDTASRLAIFFSVSPEFWLNLQNQYDLMKSLKSANGWRQLTKTIQPYGRQLLSRLNGQAAKGKPVQTTLEQLEFLTETMV